MPTVKVKFEGDTDIRRAFLNDKALTFDSDGEAQRNLAPGRHALSWFVRGTPGTEFSIAITEPEGSKFKVEDTIDPGTRDGGFKLFTVGGDE